MNFTVNQPMLVTTIHSLTRRAFQAHRSPLRTKKIMTETTIVQVITRIPHCATNATVSVRIPVQAQVPSPTTMTIPPRVTFLTTSFQCPKKHAEVLVVLLPFPCHPHLEEEAVSCCKRTMPTKPNFSVACPRTRIAVLIPLANAVHRTFGNVSVFADPWI